MYSGSSRINDLEDHNTQGTSRRRKRNMKKKNEETFRDLNNSIRKGNIRVMSVPEGGERREQKIYSKK